MIRSTLLLLCAGLLAACASGPRYDTTGVDPALTPARAAAAPDTSRGQTVIWGGVILATSNLKDGTQIEVLGYPLNGSQEPEIGAPAGGRFLAFWPKYLESMDFAAGRQITVRGQLEGTRTGQIGESRYIYPQVRAEDLWLWPRPGSTADPQFHVGFGLFLHN